MFSSSQVQQFCKEINYRESDLIKIQEILLKEDIVFQKIAQSTNMYSQDNLSKQYLLGQGGQAFVVLGKKMKTNEEVAIKFSRSNNQAYEEMVKELNCIKRIINYDYIVEVKQHFFLKSEQICIQVIELCSKNLQQEINELSTKAKQHSKEQAMFILFSAINALCEIHTNNIIHFDIKPSNILITNDNRYKLADFGHSKNLEDGQSHIESFGGGSYFYNSPEQYQANINESTDNQNTQMRRSTDIFSMGVSLLEVIGVKIDGIVFNTIQQNKIDELDSRIKHEYKDIYVFIKYFMLQHDFNKRFSAVRLRQIFLYQFKDYPNYQVEVNRLQRSIHKFENVDSKEKNKKYLLYLYYFLAQVTGAKQEQVLINQALSIIEELNLKNQIEQSIVLQEQGAMLQHLNRFQESEEFMIQSILLLKNLYNPDHIDIGFSYLFLSNLYLRACKFQQCLDSSLHGIIIFEQNFQSNLPLIALFFSNLGNSLSKIGDYNKALSTHQTVLTIREKLFHGNHSDLAQSLNNIGTCFGKLGDTKRALEYLLRAHIMREALFEGNHPDLAESLNNIGTYFGKLGDTKQELEYNLKALTMREALFEGNHPDLAQSLNNIGYCFGNLGDTKKALEYLLKAHTMFVALFQGDHPDLIQSLNNIGYCFGNLGDTKKEIEYYQRALTMCVALFQGNHPDLALSLNNIGYCFGKLGDSKQALEYLLKALEMREALFQGNHPDLAISLDNIGNYFWSLGDTKKALEYNLKALTMREALFEGNHPDLAESLNNIGNCFGNLGQTEKALKYLLRALTMRDALFHENSSDLALSLINIGAYFGKLGDSQKELEYYMRAQTMYDTQFQGFNPDLEASLNNIGYYYLKIGQTIEGEKYFKRASEMKRYIEQQ